MSCFREMELETLAYSSLECTLIYHGWIHIAWKQHPTLFVKVLNWVIVSKFVLLFLSIKQKYNRQAKIKHIYTYNIISFNLATGDCEYKIEGAGVGPLISKGDTEAECVTKVKSLPPPSKTGLTYYANTMECYAGTAVNNGFKVFPQPKRDNIRCHVFLGTTF